MSHHHVRVKSERCVHDDLVGGLAHHRWQPPRLSRVHKEEDGIVRIHKLLEFGKVRFHLGFVQNGVTQHRHRQMVPFRLDARINLFQGLGST